MLKTFRAFTVALVAAGILLLLIGGCSKTDHLRNIAGQWKGKNTNDATDQSWAFQLYLEQAGKQISGIYSDYHGSFSLENAFYDGDTISFIISIYPDTVTYFGTVSSDAYIEGTWSFSADGNNGTWTLTKDEAEF
jgi:hypothetical protein